MIRLGICAVILVGVYCWGYSNASDHYKAELANAENENRLLIIEQERKANEKQNAIVADYLKQIEEIREKAKNESIIPSDTVKLDRVCKQNSSGAGVLTKATTKSSVTCYTEAELQRKIEETLAIGAEADELALKYKALLEVCK